MKRIKDITKISLASGMLLAEMKKGKSRIILTESTKIGEGDFYAEVTLITDGVARIKVGDIILKANLGRAHSFKWKDKEYMIIPEHSIDLSVTNDNFDIDAV